MARGKNRLAKVVLAMTGVLAAGATLALAAAPEAGAPANIPPDRGTIALAIAIVVGAACIGAGIAVGRVGSAALGAASERPEMLGRSLILVGLAEGIAIYGLIIGILLLTYLK